MLTNGKNREQNYLTVSGLKLDDVFSDVFGISSSSITNYMLNYPGVTFDVAPCIDGRCKTPVEEIQVVFDDAISSELAVKLHQCRAYIDEFENHRSEIE